MNRIRDVFLHLGPLVRYHTFFVVSSLDALRKAQTTENKLLRSEGEDADEQLQNTFAKVE